METLDDPRWYRVAHLRLRLRAHVRVQRRVVRGAVWYVLCDDVRRRFHRVQASAYQIVGRLDGQRSLDEVWRDVHRRLGEHAPTQGEALGILMQLSDADLTTLSVAGDGQAIARHRDERLRRIQAAAVNPLFFKVPLFDPSRLLQALLPVARGLFAPAGFALWLLLVLWGGTRAAAQADALGAALAQQWQTPGFLIKMWVVYPLAKVVHELAHALAVRRWGGEVREVGIHLVLMTPLPYVDASAANGFARRRHRVAVSAVGVMAELGLAAAAVLLWGTTQSAGLQQAALAMAAACSLSAIVFNANPLARMDGYYILCDALDLPNLQQRGRAMVAYLFQRLSGGAGDWVRPEASDREATLVTLHALLSWCYQALVLFALVWWLYGVWPVPALVVLALGLIGLVGPPLKFLARFIALDSRLNGRRVRVLSLLATGLGGLVVLLFVVPAPSATVQQGVAWAPPEAILRVEVDGEVATVHARTRERVDAGQPIATLDNLALRSERESALARQRTLEVQYFNALLARPGEARQLELERDAVQARLLHLDTRLKALTLKAGAVGTLILPRDGLQPGQFHRQGTEVGHILVDRPGLLVKVALDEAQAALVRERTTAVSVRLANAQAQPLPARLSRETPGVARTLPTALLGAAAGGPVPTDPADSQGRTTLSPVVVVDVEVPGQPTRHLGARVWVRFEHPGEPLARQWGRVLRQAFLGRLGDAS